MVRETAIKALRDVLYLDEYGGTIETADKGYLDSFETKAIRILDALTFAGMVVVNATPTDAEIEKISEGMGWTGDEPTIRMWVECLIREMREAANAER